MVGTVTNGSARRTPFSMTRSWPPCKQTKSRPSGEKSIAVGLGPTLEPNWVSTKPGGRTAAGSDDLLTKRAIAMAAISREKQRLFFIRERPWVATQIH